MLGAMYDSDYDIYCPLMGGYKDRVNYRTISCRERRIHGCKNYNCGYNKTKIHVKEKPKLKLKKPTRPKLSVRICTYCGKLKEINGRELCGRCYGFHYYGGTLHLYPKSRTIKQKDI